MRTWRTACAVTLLVVACIASAFALRNCHVAQPRTITEWRRAASAFLLDVAQRVTPAASDADITRAIVEVYDLHRVSQFMSSWYVPMNTSGHAGIYWQRTPALLYLWIPSESATEEMRRCLRVSIEHGRSPTVDIVQCEEGGAGAP